MMCLADLNISRSLFIVTLAPYLLASMTSLSSQPRSRRRLDICSLAPTNVTPYTLVITCGPDKRRSDETSLRAGTRAPRDPAPQTLEALVA